MAIEVATFDEGFGLNDLFSSLGNDSFDFNTLISLDDERIVDGTFKGFVDVIQDGVCPFALITIYKGAFNVTHLTPRGSGMSERILEMLYDDREPPHKIVCENFDSFYVSSLIVGYVNDVVVVPNFSVNEFHELLVEQVWDQLKQ